VPISLLVTLETIKVAQGYFMHKDKKMNSDDSNPLDVHTSSLNEELGQIEYVFSDKTGTLTCNKMDFKRISIKGKSYGKIDPTNPKYINDYKDFPVVTNVDFRDRNLFDMLNNKESSEDLKKGLFFLSICHSVVAEMNGNATVYNASSPDELALVNFAKFCGFEFKGINENREIMINMENKENTFKFLYEFEFNSDRKRHSIIFEDHKREIHLFCKGADSVIESLLDMEQTKKNQ
jgi:phospholipid-transporting ATPase